MFIGVPNRKQPQFFICMKDTTKPSFIIHIIHHNNKQIKLPAPYKKHSGFRKGVWGITLFPPEKGYPQGGFDKA